MVAANSISLEDYLADQVRLGAIDRGLGELLEGVAASCCEVSAKLKTHSLDCHGNSSGEGGRMNVQGETQKSMDVVANAIFLDTLRSVDSLVAMASEEEEDWIDCKSNSNNDCENHYEIAFDPLDGSGNLDTNLPTGSIFGIASRTTSGDDDPPFSRPGSDLVVGGYSLYSSSTELVLALGKDHPDGVVGFTLVENTGFILSRTQIKCPPHGPYYSLNEAREPDWPPSLQQWIADAKTGSTATKQTYSSRYVCSLCADFHRTLLQGGWCGNPRPHLRLLYEAAPLAFVMEAAGGSGTDGTSKQLLDVVPEGLHDRLSVFLGSSEDIADLVSYGDVRQVEFKRYNA